MIQHDVFTSSNSIGPGHQENQDSFLASTQSLLFAVADGVGGYKGGKEASSLAIERLQLSAEKIRDESSMTAMLETIDGEIRQRARLLHFKDMGTTIAVAKLLPDSTRLITGNVGDSPLLFFRSNAPSDSVETVYADDSYREEDPSSMWGITQYLGVEEVKVHAHTRMFEYSTGDILLICSDGITDNLLFPDSQRERLAKLARRSRSAKLLVEEAIRAGIKHDDMTAIIISL